MNINKDFVLRHIHGRHILMPVHRNEISSDPILLNDTAAYIWETVSQFSDRDTIIKVITEHFSLTTGSVEQLAIENFLNHMLSVKLIEEGTVCHRG